MKTKTIILLAHALSLLLYCTSFSQVLYPQNRLSARSVGFGSANISSLQNPHAVISNPAALALMQDMELTVTAFDSRRINFVGLANFFPDLGSFGASYSRLHLTGTDVISNRYVDRWSLAYGRSFSNALLAGTALHWNRLTSASNSLTFSASLLAFPATNFEIQRLFPNSVSLFNNVILPQKFAVTLAAQDIAIGKKAIDPYVDIGSYYRLYENGPTLLSTLRLSENDQMVGVGANFPIKHYVDFFAGIESFDIKKAALGASIRFPRQSLDIAYSFAEKALFLDFSTRIGKSPLQRAKKYREQGIYYARQRAHEKALEQIKKYLSYLPDDSETLVLHKWLLDQIQEREGQIKQLIDIAAEYEQKHWYIRAALTYKHILKLDQQNEHARARLSAIKSNVEKNLNRLYEVGLAEFRRGNLITSERAFSTILQVQPNHEGSKQHLEKVHAFYAQNAEELYYRGLGFYNQKRYDKAVGAFQEALEYDPDNLEAQKYLALSQEMQGKVNDQTEQLFETAQRYERQNQILNAYQIYKKIITLNPENDEANFAFRQLAPKINRSLQRMENRGKAYFESGDFERARSLFHTLLNYDATSNVANTYLTRIEEEDRRKIDELYQKGISEFDRRNWDKAIALFDSLLSMQSNYELAQEKRREALSKSSFEELLNTADAFYRSGKFMKAIDYYQQVQSRVPDNENIRLRIAECREKLNAFVDLHFSKAINLYAAEDYSGAIRELEVVLEADPSHTGSQEYLKKAQKRLIAIETLQ